MSPEQVRAKELDARTDLFSFGAVLYEMATGGMPFRGESSAVIFEAIMNRSPVAAVRLNPQVPVKLEDIINRALEKDRELRYQHASDMRVELQRLKRDTESGREELTKSGTTSVATDSDTRVAVPQSPHPSRLSPPLKTPSLSLVRNSASWKVLLSVSLIGVAVAVGLYYRSHRVKPLTEKDSLVIGDFDNKTGDAVFDGALKQALVVNLSESPFLNVISDRKVSEILRMMGGSPNDPVTMDVGRELCQRTGSKVLLGGTISSLGSHYLVDLNAVACGTGDNLAKEQLEAANKEDVLKALRLASSNLRTKLGESLPSVQKFEVPMEATTTSLEALKSYSMGVRMSREKGEPESVPFMKRAIELDPNFPMAYAGLAIAYGNLNQPSLALEYATRAYQLRDRVTGREKLRVSATYFRVTGDVEKETQTYELWIASYPRDYVAHNNLGVTYLYTGQYEKALPEFQENLRLVPEIMGAYVALGTAYLCLDRLGDANKIFDQAFFHKLDGGGVRQGKYVISFLQDDSAQMEQQVAWGAGKPGDEDVLLALQSDTESYYGHLGRARDYSRRAVESAVRANSKETAALWQVNAALREAEFGNIASAKQGVAAALALSSGRDVKIAAALTLARIGDASRALVLAKELANTYPNNTLLKVYWLPSIKAAIELSKGNSSQAIMLLEAAAPYELGIPPPMLTGTLYPAYLRGQAYLLAHNAAAATAEFQKVLDHKGIVANFVIGSLVHLQNGRAFAMAGDTAKAKSTYQGFFALWNEPDPDIPILKEAKAEYAKLQ